MHSINKPLLFNDELLKLEKFLYHLNFAKIAFYFASLAVNWPLIKCKRENLPIHSTDIVQLVD